MGGLLLQSLFEEGQRAGDIAAGNLEELNRHDHAACHQVNGCGTALYQEGE